MSRTSTLVLLFVAIVGATLPAFTEEPVSKQAPSDSKELLRQANDLRHLKKDYNGALAAFNQAVDAAPNDGDVRLPKGHLF
jgi:hypothetical protein